MAKHSKRNKTPIPGGSRYHVPQKKQRCRELGATAEERYNFEHNAVKNVGRAAMDTYRYVVDRMANNAAGYKTGFELRSDGSKMVPHKTHDISNIYTENMDALTTARIFAIDPSEAEFQILTTLDYLIYSNAVITIHGSPEQAPNLPLGSEETPAYGKCEFDMDMRTEKRRFFEKSMHESLKDIKPDVGIWPFEKMWISTNVTLAGSGRFGKNSAANILMNDYLYMQLPLGDDDQYSAFRNSTTVTINGILYYISQSSAPSSGCPIINMHVSFCGTDDKKLNTWINLYTGDEWIAYAPPMGAPYWTEILIHFINNHGEYIKRVNPSATEIYDHKKTQKKTTHQLTPPKPYYLITLPSNTNKTPPAKRLEGLTSQMEKIRRTSPSYRFEVRGHEACRVCRGKLPMAHEAYDDLVTRGYRIYENEQPNPRDAHRLAIRNMPPKGTDEWVAILTSWVNDHEKGPQDQPIVPATRIAV